MFQPLIVIDRMGDFMYHHWGCTSFYRPLSYLFRSLLVGSCLTFVQPWMVIGYFQTARFFIWGIFVLFDPGTLQ